MKKILVPTDFSNVALDAFKFAVEVAVASGGEIKVLHVVEMPAAYATDLDGFDYSFDPQVLKVMHKNAAEKFAKWEKYSAKLEKITFTVESGPPAVVIEQFIKKNKIDLVVMGTHGASGLKEFFIGSNTEKIVRFSKVPVFAIPKFTKLSSIKTIVFPTQLKLNETSLIAKVKDLQKFLGAKLKVIYVNTPVNFRKQHDIDGLLKDYVKHYALSNCDTSIVNDAYEQQGIIDFVKKIPGSMIAMSTHGRRGLSHFFNMSIAEEVVNHVNCPIWTFSIKGIK